MSAKWVNPVHASHTPTPISEKRVHNVRPLIPNVLPLFYPQKTKSAVILSITTLYVFFFVVPPGIEPGTQGFSVLCSTN